MTHSMLSFNLPLAYLVVYVIFDSLSVHPVDAVVEVTLDVPHTTWEGEGTLMKCTLRGNITTVRLEWYIGNYPNTKTSVYQLVRSKDRNVVERAQNNFVNRAVGWLAGKVHHLYINKTELTDGQMFTCVSGFNNSSSRLTVNVKPQGVTITDLSQPVSENSQVEVKCHVSRVKPQADIYWRKGPDGQLQQGIVTTVPDSSTSDGPFRVTSTYKVAFSRNDHNKKLYCLVTPHGTGFWNINTSVMMYVKYPPIPNVKRTSSQNPKDGSSVTLTCDITVSNPAKITSVTWQKGSTSITSSGPYKLSGRDLTISSLDHSRDDGNYSCAAHNDAGTGKSGPFQLFINYKPVVSVETPDTVVEGQSVTIMCQSQGARPDVNKVTWMKGQEVIRATSDIRYTGGTAQNPSLTIKLVTRNDVGRYTCQLRNDIGHSNKIVELHVWYKPYGKATVESGDVTVAVGGHVTLACKEPTEPGNPAASWFYWRKQNSDFSSNTTGFLIVIPSNVNESSKYSCVAGNSLGQSDESDWTTVTVQVPPETPTHLAILDNSTSVALTLQWQPGVTGSDSQIFVVQYTAVTKSNVHYSTAVAAAGDKQQQLTVVGLEPETLYKFTLFAHNNNTDVIRSGVTSASGWTAASPELTIQSVDIKDDYMTVTWSNNIHDSRHKRSATTIVSVVIHYQKDDEEESRYPPEGSVNVKRQTVVISEHFDTKATYKIWLKVYEGQLMFPSKIIHPVEVTTIKEKGNSCGTVTIIAAVLGSLLIVSIVALVFCCIWRTRQSHCNEDPDQTRQAEKREPPIEMSGNTKPSTEVDDTTCYQHLSNCATADTSALPGAYSNLEETDVSRKPGRGAAYEEVDAITRQRLTYINTSMTGGDAAEYAEVA